MSNVKPITKKPEFIDVRKDKHTVLVQKKSQTKDIILLLTHEEAKYLKEVL